MTISDWQDKRYAEIFESTCRYLEVRRAHYGLTVAELEEMLAEAYRRQGNDWLGRGMVKDVGEDAVVAAYEHVLTEWRAVEAQESKDSEKT